MPKLLLIGPMLLSATVLLYGWSLRPLIPDALKQSGPRGNAQVVGDPAYSKEAFEGTRASPLLVNVNCPGCPNTYAIDGTDKSDEKLPQRRSDDLDSWVAQFTGVLMVVACIQTSFFVWQLTTIKDSLVDGKLTSKAAGDAPG